MYPNLIENPLISVVIPTKNRKNLVMRAVKSVLSQTLSHIEVVVVIDGPDQAARVSLESIDDARVRIIELPQNIGAAEARNLGVQKAKAAWVAFLDDDDEWFQNKLGKQLQHALSLSCRYPVISCRLIKRDGKGNSTVPKREPGAEEDISEYLFCRNNLFWGEGLIQTSTILTKRKLLLKAPFKDIPFHNDLDWILRIKNIGGVRISFVPSPEPLLLWHCDDFRQRISNRVDWQYSASWIKSVSGLVTDRAHVSFLLTWASAYAAQSKNYHAFPILLKEAWKYGRPSLIDIIIWLYNWILPNCIQEKISFFSKAIIGKR